jgi:predicted ester cyclase
VTNAPTSDSVERNKAASRRWIEVAEAWTRFLAGFVEAFPDLQLTMEDAVGEGDLVAQRVHFAGTHTLGLVVVPGPRLLPRVLAHQLKKLRKKRA